MLGTEIRTRTGSAIGMSMPAVLVRLEGTAVLVAMLAIWITQGWSGWLFLALLFLPDLSMIGYLKGPRAGAVVYNAVHTYPAPLTLAALALASGTAGLLPFAVVWVAHIGMDRTLGFGLKYPTEFKDTHLNRL